MKYPSLSEFKNNFSEDALDQMAKQARATVELHRDWPEEMKDAFAKSTYQFLGYRALFQKYAKKARELEMNGGGSQEFQQLKQQYQTLQNEYHSVRSQFDQFKEKFDSIQIENMRLNSQVSDLQEQLEDAMTVPVSQSNSNETAALQQEIASLKKQNAELSAQIQNVPEISASLPKNALALLNQIAQELQNQNQYSSELSFLALEKDCLSEIISTLHPDEENTELPLIQERFSQNHRKTQDLQEKLQQSQSHVEELQQTIQEDFLE